MAWLVLLRTDATVVLGVRDSDDSAVASFRTVLAIVVPAALVVLGVHAWWRLRLEVLAYRPGPLLVHAIDDHTAPADGLGAMPGKPGLAESSLAEYVRAELQRQLIAMRLHGSTAIPSPGRASDFVQVAEETGERVEGLASALLRLPRILSPRSSYEVRCVILSPAALDRTDRCILVLDLLRAPKHALAPQTFVGSDWDDVASQAANWVCAMVLPRTGKSRLAPWTMWRGLHLDPDLFREYQRFQRCRADAENESNAAEQRKHYDAALRILDSALDRDPLNLALRLEKGKLFEQTERYLEALEIYDRILSQAARRNRRLAYLRFGPPPSDRREPDEGANRRWSDRRRVRGLGETDPTVIVARYRFALLLCLGHELAAVWWYPVGLTPVVRGDVESGAESLRDVRRSLAKRMATAYAAPMHRMQAQFTDVFKTLRMNDFLADDVIRYAPEGEATRELTDDERRQRYRAARLFFTSIGMWEVEHLLTEQPAYQPGALARREVVPRRSVELLLPRAILLRALAIIESAQTSQVLARAAHSMLFPIDECVLDPQLGTVLATGWPESVSDLERWIKKCFGRGAGVRTWHEHYNAACVLSILLQHPHLRARGKEPRLIADAAVTELEKAVACGGSAHLASQGTWIVSRDPDLASLREQEAFDDFKITVLGRRRGQ